MDKLSLFFSKPFYFIQQIKEWAEIIVDFETANKYRIEDENNQTLGGIYERGSGFTKMLARQFFRSHRPLEVEIVDPQGEILLTLKRPFFFFFSKLTILDVTEKSIGTVERRFGFFLFKRYDLYDNNQTLFATINSPIWRIWTFKVLCNKTNQELANISKRWGGLLKEAFTDADRFGIQYNSANLTTEQKAITFCSAVSIDFDFFEDNQRSN